MKQININVRSLLELQGVARSKKMHMDETLALRENRSRSKLHAAITGGGGVSGEPVVSPRISANHYGYREWESGDKAI